MCWMTPCSWLYASSMRKLLSWIGPASDAAAASGAARISASCNRMIVAMRDGDALLAPRGRGGACGRASSGQPRERALGQGLARRSDLAGSGRHLLGRARHLRDGVVQRLGGGVERRPHARVLAPVLAGDAGAQVALRQRVEDTARLLDGSEDRIERVVHPFHDRPEITLVA